MVNTFYNFLLNSTKEELITMIYKPFKATEQCISRSTRRIALRISYDGQNYNGLQQHQGILSIEECLQNALSLTNLGKNIVFCGRTDAGVSAINMVANIDANSRLETPNRTFNIIESDYDEYPYDIMLNKLLPNDIRITGWAPVTDGFSSRHDCIQRKYKYYFSLNNLSLDKMKEAANEILKMNDFYYLCTRSNPKAIYKRSIDELFIEQINEPSIIKEVAGNKDSPPDIDQRQNNKLENHIKDTLSYTSHNKLQHELQKARTRELRMQYNARDKPNRSIDNDVYCLNIKARSFLHNMVRKIFWAIKNCGKGKPLILKAVEIADAAPLVFVGCEFKDELNFIGNKYSERHFKQEEEAVKIKLAISRLRYHKFDQK